MSVFISYSSADKAWADAACDSLEARGFPCWIAPRDVTPGSDWSESILRAIAESKVVLLILSSNSNNSQQVEREVECAIRKGNSVLPLRLQNLPLSAGMQFYIGDTRCLDAFETSADVLWDDLAAAINRLLNRAVAAPPAERKRRFTTLQWSLLLLTSLILSISTLYAFAQLYPVVKDRWEPRVLNEPKQVENLSRKYYDEGNRQFDEGDYKNAIVSFEKALQVDPKNSSIYDRRGQAYSRTKNYTSAIQDYSQAIQLDANNPQYFHNRGEAYTATGQNQLAVGDYTSALSLNPNDKEALENRAEAYRTLGDEQKALQDYDQLVQMNPQGDTYYERAAIEYKMGEYSLALGDYSRAIRIRPQFPRAYNGRGLCHQASRNWPAAIADFTKAIRQDPKYSEAYCNRGYARLMSGDTINARKDFESCGRMDPNQKEWIKGKLNEIVEKKSKSAIKKLGDKIKKIF